MKKYIYLSVLLFLFACQKEDTVVPQLEDFIKEYREDDAVKLETSSRMIKLDPLKRRDQALLVTWETLNEIEELYPVKYLFKIDLTENNFSSTAITKEIEAGVNYFTFTHEELEDLIRHTWGRKENDYISVSVRVIAQISSEEKYIMPLYSTKEVQVLPFNIESSPLFLYGSVVPGGNPDNMIELEEYKNGEVYVWRGFLNEGESKLATIMGEKYPAYVKGDDNESLRFIEDSDGNESGIVIEQSGNYAVVVNRVRQKISFEKIAYLDLYFGGSATATGWQTPPKVEWDPYRPNVCSITLPLSSGECKFSLEPNFSAATMQIRPTKPDASIQDDEDVIISNNNPDWKWRVNSEEAGTYKVVLDVKSMKAEFIKLN